MVQTAPMSVKASAMAGLAALAHANPVAADTSSGPGLEARSDVPEGYYVPPYYPAPYGGWVDSWAESYDKARALVDSMTLAEKTNITAGTGIFMGKKIPLFLFFTVFLVCGG